MTDVSHRDNSLPNVRGKQIGPAQKCFSLPMSLPLHNTGTSPGSTGGSRARKCHIDFSDPKIQIPDLGTKIQNTESQDHIGEPKQSSNNRAGHPKSSPCSLLPPPTLGTPWHPLWVGKADSFTSPTRAARRTWVSWKRDSLCLPGRQQLFICQPSTNQYRSH